MLVKILTFVAGAIIATIVTLWTRDNVEGEQATGRRTFHGGNHPDNREPSPLNDSLACVICMVNPKDRVLQPCGHVCCCSDCAQQIVSCPICRKSIYQISRAFI